MCARGSCGCRPAPSSAGRSALSAAEGVGPVLAAGCVLAWRFWTGARLLAELPDSRPRKLARHVHATVRGLSVTLTAGLCWDWRITTAVAVLALAGLVAAGLTYRHRTRPIAREQIIYAGRAYTTPRATITRARQS